MDRPDASEADEMAPIDPQILVANYRTIGRDRMQGLPFVNPRLEVEAVGVREFDEHLFGILIAPWFMNMLLLPGSDEWSALDPGDKVTIALPAGDYEFTLCRDEGIDGHYLSAVLFRTVADFPDQATARDVAFEIIERLFVSPAEESSAQGDGPAGKRRYSRRELLSGGGAD